MKKNSFTAFIFIALLSIAIFSCKNTTETTQGIKVDSVKIANFNPTVPEWTKHSNIYEVNIRQYTQEGTFKAFEAHLPRLKKMGVDILWLMPIHPIGVKNRKGSMGSYYAVKDYLAVNPDYGTMEDFKNLVNKAHESGMHVILDWVANHSAPDNNLITEHPEYYTKDSAGNFVPPVADWSDVTDFNYDNAGMREYMRNAMKFWVKETNIDGYRCDVAGMVPVDFWVSVRESLDSIKPVFMLAENEGDYADPRGFDMNYGWAFHHIMNKIAKGEKDANSVDSFFIADRTKYNKEFYRMQFTSSHDENSWNGSEYERLGEAVKVFASLSFTVPGMPMIYSGQEVGVARRLKFFEKDPIEWKEHEMSAMYKKLIQLKNENQALWNGDFGGDFTRIKTNDDKAVFAFTRTKDQNSLFCVYNLSKNKVTITIDNEAVVGNYTNYMANKTMEVKKGTKITLDPWSEVILIKK